jgi:hypothetical protein
MYLFSGLGEVSRRNARSTARGRFVFPGMIAESSCGLRSRWDTIVCVSFIQRAYEGKPGQKAGAVTPFLMSVPAQNFTRLARPTRL